VRADLFGEQRDWWEWKLRKIVEKNWDFEEVYCSREEGLVCLERKCKDCGDEEVGKIEACHPDEVGYERTPVWPGKGGDDDDGDEDGGQQRPSSTSTTEVSSSTPEKVTYSAGGDQDGGRSCELSLLLGIVSTILLFR
jgi:hypothetical protein